MKKMLQLCLITGILFGITAFASAQCTTIQEGTLINSAGEVIMPGYDDWGYNYQARMFNGTYCDAYRNAGWCQPYVDEELIMKWNNAWLSSKDCDGDGKLDRHFGYTSYKGSGAWLTNHQSGLVEVNGKQRRWTYFVKIVAAPADAVLDGNLWKTSEGVVIGPTIWGEFAVIQEIYNDPSNGAHGVLYKSPSGPGFGQYAPE